MKEPKTLQEAIQYFSDEQVCIEAVAAMRWPDRVQCPHCLAFKPYYLKKQKRWKCSECRKQFSVKVDSIFEDSPISLTKWLPALWLLVNCKNGISSYELARDLGVTQKSAWFILHRLRLGLEVKSLVKMGGKKGGPVEMDETFIGGRSRNMHAKRRNSLKAGLNGDHKTPVFGMLDRNTRQVRATAVSAVKRDVLLKLILDNVERKSTIYTDDAMVYQPLKVREFVHDTVTHVEEYVRGEVHTQGIENFWSLLKRGLKGTYVSVEPYHLDRYVAEQVFRYNNRATKDNPLDDADRFLVALSQVANKRLTYAELTGKTTTTQA
ncbi:MAG TPA: IS1595 family transposase [Acidobacteriaceae bacterium]|nr:IS1595 family transposase [Acidobacteriaceae bacterium]